MMNRYVVFIAVAFLTTMLYSCNNARTNTNTNNPLCISGDVYELASTPEDLLTDEQFNIAKHLVMIKRTSVILEGDRIVNTATSEDFERLGIPIIYYHLLNEAIIGMNKEIPHIRSAEEVYNDMMMSIDGFFERNKARIGADL